MSPHECTLVSLAEAPPKGHCVRCGSALTGRQRRWCSQACVDRWLSDHEWGAARAVAIERARVPEQWARVVGWGCLCDQCGKHTTDYEVNHVEPRVGRGYDKGCHNHQTNLQVLCHACHVAETARQKRERIAGACEDDGRRLFWPTLFASWADAEHYIETGEHPCPAPAVDQTTLGLVAA